METRPRITKCSALSLGDQFTLSPLRTQLRAMKTDPKDLAAEAITTVLSGVYCAVGATNLAVELLHSQTKLSAWERETQPKTLATDNLSAWMDELQSVRKSAAAVIEPAPVLKSKGAILQQTISEPQKVDEVGDFLEEAVHFLAKLLPEDLAPHIEFAGCAVDGLKIGAGLLGVNDALKRGDKWALSRYLLSTSAGAFGVAAYLTGNATLGHIGLGLKIGNACINLQTPLRDLPGEQKAPAAPAKMNQFLESTKKAQYANFGPSVGYLSSRGRLITPLSVPPCLSIASAPDKRLQAL